MFRAIAVIAVVMIHTTPYRQLGKHIQLFWNDACMGWFTFHYLGLILGNKIIDRQFNIRNPAVLCFSAAADGRGISVVCSRLLCTIGDDSFIPYPITSLIVLSVSFIFCYVCTAVMGKRAGRWVGFI